METLTKVTCEDTSYNVLFSRNESNEISCISATCTHRPVLMSKALRSGNHLRCCIHGAVFNIENGKVINAPATKPLRSFPVRIGHDDILEIDVEDKEKSKQSVTPKSEKVVIVGSGAAGISAAEQLITKGYEVKIITADNCAPYDRTMISKQFAHVPYSSALEGVEFITEFNLVNIDEKRKKISILKTKPNHHVHQKFATNISSDFRWPRKDWKLADIEFDKLILATGLKTREIKPGGLSIYSAADAQHLNSGVTNDKHIGIIGGSFLVRSFTCLTLRSITDHSQK